MSFLTEFKTVDEDTISAPWGRCIGRKAFFCAFCQHDFVIGDEYRMIFTNDTDGPGNPLTCKPCFDKHGGYSGLRKLWAELWQEYRTRFKWWWVTDGQV